jgi:hypothetical protein
VKQRQRPNALRWQERASTRTTTYVHTEIFVLDNNNIEARMEVDDELNELLLTDCKVWAFVCVSVVKSFVFLW